VLGGLAQAGTKALGGDRFGLVNLTPAALLVTFVGLLAASGLYAGEPFDLPELGDDLGSSAGWVLLAAFAVYLLAVIVRPFQIALVWVLEGYWDRWPALEPVKELALERHRRRLHTAEVIRMADDEPRLPGPASPESVSPQSESPASPSPSPSLEEVARALRLRRRWRVRRARAERLTARYPAPRVARDDKGKVVWAQERLMPTALGNALRRGEDIAGDRYGLDFPVIAPRLYPFIKDKTGAAINRNLDAIESGAALCVTFALASVLSLPLIGRADGWRVTPLVAALLAVAAYRGSLRTARAHGRLLATAVDLHRFDMIAALRYPLHTDVADERALNLAISDFLRGGDAATERMRRVPYAHPPEPVQVALLAAPVCEGGRPGSRPGDLPAPGSNGRPRGGGPAAADPASAGTSPGAASTGGAPPGEAPSGGVPPGDAPDDAAPSGDAADDAAPSGEDPPDPGPGAG